MTPKATSIPNCLKAESGVNMKERNAIAVVTADRVIGTFSLSRVLRMESCNPMVKRYSIYLSTKWRPYDELTIIINIPTVAVNILRGIPMREAIS